MIEATSCGGVVIFRGKILLLYKNYKELLKTGKSINRQLFEKYWKNQVQKQPS